MLVIAQHDIQNPKAFWSTAQSLNAMMPEELRLLSVFPSKDLKTGTCIWEAPSADMVQQFIDKHVGHVSKNYCYEVDEVNAMGMPKRTLEATL